SLHAALPIFSPGDVRFRRADGGRLPHHRRDAEPFTHGPAHTGRIRHGPPDAGRAGHRTAARPDHPAAPHRLGPTSPTVPLGPPPPHPVPHTAPDGTANDPRG